MLSQLSNIVTEVGQLLLEWRSQGITDGFWEAPYRFKAKVDGMAHTELVERLKDLGSKTPIISEEDVDSHVNGRPPAYWLIDPLDGTASYARGYGGFVTQAALMVDGMPTLSAIYAPVYKQLYVAERTCGAFLNGYRMPGNTRRAETLIDNFPEMSGYVLDAYNSLGLTHYVECGGISLKICRVADGSADLFFKKVMVYNWDVAAPQLVLEEAGGMLTDGNGRPITYKGDYWIPGMVAANTKETHDRWVEWNTHYLGVLWDKEKLL